MGLADDRAGIGPLRRRTRASPGSGPAAVAAARRRRGFTAVLLALWAGAAVAACPRPRLVAVAPQVFAAVAPPALRAAPQNCGRIANSGVIVGPAGVVVIDPGPNRNQGRALAREIGRLGAGPVRAVVLTHAHAENVLAAVAFARPGVAVLASAAAAALMAERCPRCLAGLREAAGAAAMAGTRIVLPSRAIAAPTDLELAGRRLRLIPFAAAHTPGDLAVLDLASGVLFAGGLVDAGQLPETREASFAGWLAALERLAAEHPRRVVPGHGAPAGPALVGEMAAYLAELRAGALREVEAGSDLPGGLARLAMPDYAGRLGYAERHPLNIQRAWREAEEAFFAGR